MWPDKHNVWEVGGNAMIEVCKNHGGESWAQRGHLFPAEVTVKLRWEGKRDRGKIQEGEPLKNVFNIIRKILNS